MIEFEKIRALIADNFYYFSTYWIIEIFLILCSVYM